MADNTKEQDRQQQQQQQHQQSNKLVISAEEGFRSQPNAATPLISANRLQVATSSPVASPGKWSAKKTLSDSGIQSSVQTSWSNNEAQRLLDLSDTTAGKACLCGCTGCGASQYYRRSANEEQQQHQQQQQDHQPLAITSLKAQTLRLALAYFVAELLGTFLLVLIGDGAIAAYTFNKRPVDAFSVCLAFGIGAMIASYVSFKLSGAHLNPAATLAFALDNKLKWELVPVYMVAQYIGGFLAALVLFLNYSEAINSFDGGNRSAFGTNQSTGGIFATYPAPYVTVWGSLIDQIVGTGVLLFSLSAIGDKLNLSLEDRFQPPIVALAIGLVCFAFNVNCGAIFNPARDLSPRLLTALLGYPGVWTPIEGTYWILAGVVGPHIGAIIGVFAYKYLIGTALEAGQRHVQMLERQSAAPSQPPSNGTIEPDKDYPKQTKLAFANPHHHHNHQNHNHDAQNHNHNQLHNLNQRQHQSK